MEETETLNKEVASEILGKIRKYKSRKKWLWVWTELESDGQVQKELYLQWLSRRTPQTLEDYGAQRKKTNVLFRAVYRESWET